MYLAKIFILPKPSILDPQGQAVKQGLESLGYQEIESLRMGRYIELVLDVNDSRQAEKKIKDYCESLLVNAVIESYQFTLEEIKG